MKAWWGARERIAGSPGAFRNLITSGALTDVRDALPLVQAPTLVIHRTDDPLSRSRRHASSQTRFPARGWSSCPDRAHCPGSTPTHFSTRSRSSSRAHVRPGRRSRPRHDPLHGHRRLDGDGSELGDSAWSRLVEQHHVACAGSSTASRARRSTPRATASLPCSTGPPGRFAARLAIQGAISGLGLEIRAGLHTGEVERPEGGKPRGIAVNVAARVSGLAESGETLVTATVRDLVARWARVH